MRLYLVLCLLALGSLLPGATVDPGPAYGVTVTLVVEERRATSAVIAATFTPRAPMAGEQPWHLYSIDLPDQGLEGLGRPTRLELTPGQEVQPLGPAQADQPVKILREPNLGLDFPVYPEGPVTLRLPVTLPGPQAVTASLLLGWQACNDSGCLRPMERYPVELPIPALQEITIPGTVRPGSLPEALAALEVARSAGHPALLDFTGISCVNCQVMAKTVFATAAVRRVLKDMVVIEVDTDPPRNDLADWQVERFGTATRPLYVRIDSTGTETRWSRVFAPTDAAVMGRFLAFLAGGPGDDAGAAAAADGTSLWALLLLAVLGGVFTLVMPCTYPMIPFTLNFFSKQASEGRSTAPLALAYGAGIVACFAGLGLGMGLLFRVTPVAFAGHPITNLAVGALFLVLGLSLLGFFFLRLPAGVTNALAGGRSGYLGALLMGLTFVVAAFTCTAPFAGYVLGNAIATGSWSRAVLGMTVYGLVLAAPFVVLGMVPEWLRRLPRAGGWMDEFKVVGGLVEIAAALKFLDITDHAWGLDLLTREVLLAVWAATALACAVYLAGWLRLHDDPPVQRAGAGRLLTVLAFLALALWLVSGLAGTHLGAVEGLFAGDAAPPLRELP